MAIINEETKKTYIWIFKNLKLLFPNLPNVFIIDEGFSVILALNNMYLDSNGSSFYNFSFDVYLECSLKFQKTYSLS